MSDDLIGTLSSQEMVPDTSWNIYEQRVGSQCGGNDGGPDDGDFNLR